MSTSVSKADKKTSPLHDSALLKEQHPLWNTLPAIFSDPPEWHSNKINNKWRLDTLVERKRKANQQICETIFFLINTLNNTYLVEKQELTKININQLLGAQTFETFIDLVDSLVDQIAATLNITDERHFYQLVSKVSLSENKFLKLVLDLLHLKFELQTAGIKKRHAYQRFAQKGHYIKAWKLACGEENPKDRDEALASIIYVILSKSYYEFALKLTQSLSKSDSVKRILLSLIFTSLGKISTVSILAQKTPVEKRALLYKLCVCSLIEKDRITELIELIAQNPEIKDHPHLIEYLEEESLNYCINKRKLAKGILILNAITPATFAAELAENLSWTLRQLLLSQSEGELVATLNLFDSIQNEDLKRSVLCHLLNDLHRKNHSNAIKMLIQGIKETNLFSLLSKK